MQELARERQGTNTLALFKLDDPVRTYRGKREYLTRYMLAHYWHSSETATGVQGDDYSYWRKSEIDFGKGLFEQFACIS